MSIKKKQAKTPFYVEGMTANDILNMTHDELSSLDERNVSRALRTLSLVANKRVNRLLKQAKKTKKGYVAKKSAKHNIALDSLNAITQDGKLIPKFGVKQAKSRNEMLKQITTIRNFMESATSTLSGATKVRQNREMRLFGETTEQAMKKEKTKKAKAKIKTFYADKMSNAYETFRKFLEYEGMPNNPYMRFAGSESILNLIGTQTLTDSLDSDDVLQKAIDYYKGAYEEHQEQVNNIVGDGFTYR